MKLVVLVLFTLCNTIFVNAGIVFRSGGATFPQEVYQHWASAYEAENTELTLEYKSTGSGIAHDVIVAGNEMSMVGCDSLFTEEDYNLVPDLQVS